jgi:hypothetical protein
MVLTTPPLLSPKPHWVPELLTRAENFLRASISTAAQPKLYYMWKVRVVKC